MSCCSDLFIEFINVGLKSITGDETVRSKQQHYAGYKMSQVGHAQQKSLLFFIPFVREVYFLI